MYTLLVLALALALLYGWLVDHWFARVLMFLLLMVCLSFGGAALLHSSPGAPPAAGAIGGIVGAVLAWPVSGIPIYYQR